jgi:hypothetical protein
MRVNNETPSTVDWEQQGNPPQGLTTQDPQQGQLGANSSTGDFTPSGEPPYSVRFTSVDKPNTATSEKFDDANATVALVWAVKVG